MKRINVSSDSLVALERLIHKVGRKWKSLMRDFIEESGDETWVGARHATFVLRLKGLTDEEIADLKRLNRDFIKKTTRPMIFQELRIRRTSEGLLK